MENGETPQQQSIEIDAANEEIAYTYLMDLGLNWDTLKNKKILDLGAGLAGFAQSAKKHDVDVVSVDAHPDWWTERGKLPKDVPYVVGDGIQLPFKEEAFDVIVARAAVHSMVEVEDDLEEVISEARRVLKPGGEFRFGPGHIGVRPVREGEWDKWFELLDKVHNKQEITPEEDAWGAKVWPMYKRELQEEEEFSGLSTEERIKKLEERSLEDLQRIDPNITAHPIVRELDWKGKLEKFPSVYYILKKSSPSDSIAPQSGSGV